MEAGSWDFPGPQLFCAAPGVEKPQFEGSATKRIVSVGDSGVFRRFYHVCGVFMRFVMAIVLFGVFVV